VVDNWYLWGVKHGLVSPYPAQNNLTAEQQELLRGRYQGTAPDSFPTYVAPQPAMMLDSTALMTPADSLPADSTRVDSLATPAAAAPAATTPAAAGPTAAKPPAAPVGGKAP